MSLSPEPSNISPALPRANSMRTTSRTRSIRIRRDILRARTLSRRAEIEFKGRRRAVERDRSESDLARRDRSVRGVFLPSRCRACWDAATYYREKIRSQSSNRSSSEDLPADRPLEDPAKVSQGRGIGKEDEEDERSSFFQPRK